MSNLKKLCLVTMSGGLDSSTLALKAIKEDYIIQPITFSYNQKHSVERIALDKILKIYKERYPDNVLELVTIDLSSVLSTSLSLWENLRDNKTIEEKTSMEFYTPSRNLVFTVLGAMIGEIACLSTSRTELLIGLGIHKHTKYDRDYWDISPEFIQKLNALFALNDCVDIKMYAPYKDLTKDKIVQDAILMGVPYKETWTCYSPKSIQKESVVENHPCLECESCIERENAGKLAGINDINYYKI